MSRFKGISFEEATEERAVQEATLSSLTAVLDEAITEDDWPLVCELEDEIHSRIDRMAVLIQDLHYLENN